MHSIAIRRLLFKPDEARRGERTREDNSKSDSKAAAREEKGRDRQAGGQNAPEIDHMGHARSGKEREVENSAPLTLLYRAELKNGPQVW